MITGSLKGRETGRPDYACVLLAGGLNSRMGGLCKADLSFRGSTIGRRIEEQMEETGALCFYSCREEGADIPDGWTEVRDEEPGPGSRAEHEDPGSGSRGENNDPGSRAAGDHKDSGPQAAGDHKDSGSRAAGDHAEEGHPGKSPVSRGPAAGICSTLKAAEARGLNGVYVASCDLPFFQGRMISLSAAEARAGNFDAVLWETRDGRRHYTCGFYSVSCLPELKDMLDGGDLRLRDLSGRVRTRFLTTKEAGIPDHYLMNVNTTGQYRSLISEKPDPLVLCVTGWKNSGKTTLLEDLVRRMTAAGIKTAVIKHDGHDFEADLPGTDSRRMKEAGACGTAVFSDTKFQIVKESPVSLQKLISWFPEADLILIEGGKKSPYPKIETLRKDSERRLAADPSTVIAYVKDWRGEDDLFPKGIPVIQSQDREEICEQVIQLLDKKYR